MRSTSVVEIYDDCPTSQWKLAVIEDLTKGSDGYTLKYIWSVNVCTANGRNNQPVAQLYPLEVSAEEYSSDVNVGRIGSVNNNMDCENSNMNRMD